MNLDIKTLMLLYVIINVISAGAVAVIWSQNRKRFAGISFWLADMILQAVGSGLILLRGLVPNWISMTLANALIQAGALLIFIGLERFSGKKGWQIHNYVLLAAFIAVSAYYGLVQPDLRAREIALSVTSMIFTFQCCWLLLRRVDPDMRRITRLVGIVFAVYAAFSLARICLHAIFPTQTSDFFKSGAVDALAITFYIVLSVCLTISLVLMVNRRLLADVRSQEEKFTTAFRSSPYAITLTRPSDGKILEVNDGFTKITGYQHAEVIGNTTIGLHLWVREEDRLAVLKELAQGREIRGVEVSFRKKTGEVITGLFSASQVKINNEIFILASISDITERKQLEKALQESGLWMKGIFNALEDSILVVTPDRRLVEINRATQKVFGYSQEELFNQSTEILHVNHEHYLEFGRRIQDAFDKGEAANFEFESRRKGGEIFPTEHTVSLLKSEKGEPEGIVSVVRDITERKRAEEALQVSETKYRVLFESLPLGVTVSDKAGNIKEANKEAERLLGLSQETQTQRSIDGQEWQIVRTDGSLMPVDEYASVRALKENRLIENVEMGIAKGNGVITWINVTATPIPLPEYGVAIAYTDISERKQAEEALRVSEVRYRSLFEHMLDGYAYCKMLYDDQGRPVDFLYLDVNSAFKRLTGLQDVVGKKVSEAIPGTIESHPELFQSYGRVALTGQPEEFEIDFQPLNKWLSISVYSQARGYFVAVFEDITERKQLEERIRQVRGDLLFAVSHDLKTPLQVLNQSQEMLSALDPGKALAQFQEYRQIWQRNLQRMERMINNLVDSQRGEDDRFPLHLAPCHLEEIVRQVVEDLTGYALASEVQFDLNLPFIPESSCDQEALARVVENLLTNAVKFSPKGGRVEIRLGMEGNAAHLEVEDHGAGISLEEQAQLFQPFQRGHSAHRKGVPGTGLGLYVCRRIMEAHGGTISLQSTEGVGTTVTVTLPLKE
jgi:PAS domain S-box-containing protein